MAGNRDNSSQWIQTALRVFWALPTQVKLVVGALTIVVVVGYLVARPHFNATSPSSSEHPSTHNHSGPAVVASGDVMLMFWNVENLFDDRADKRNSVDHPYDEWFATDAATREEKYAHLAEMIVKQNGGKGPDILACVEVESVRAGELLRDAMNAKLAAGSQKYEHLAMKELAANAGRHMSPCVISRLPLDPERTKLLGTHNLRVLETHVVVNGADLYLLASHWTSQLSDDGSHKGTGGRDKYAMTIYAEYERLMAAQPDADFLVCGDFNTTPDSEPVTGELHMTGNRSEVVATRTAPRLLGLLSGKSADEFGTHYHSKPLIYDQIGVSAGMLDDKGWSCEPGSVAVPTAGMMRGRHREPWRFGNKGGNPQGRGYSDHFPVTVNLKVAGKP
jgi:endonuclease/exonuclease/phosphatase family metal-dependent hydrolase